MKHDIAITHPVSGRSSRRLAAILVASLVAAVGLAPYQPRAWTSSHAQGEGPS